MTTPQGCLLQAKAVSVLAQSCYEDSPVVSSFQVLICDSMRRLVPRLEGRQKRKSWQSKLPSERLLHALKWLISSEDLQRKHFLRTLNLMTPQMMSLHHQIQTRFPPELLRTECCSFICLLLLSQSPCNIHIMHSFCVQCVYGSSLVEHSVFIKRNPQLLPRSVTTCYTTVVTKCSHCSVCW